MVASFSPLARSSAARREFPLARSALREIHPRPRSSLSAAAAAAAGFGSFALALTARPAVVHTHKYTHICKRSVTRTTCDRPVRARVRAHTCNGHSKQERVKEFDFDIIFTATIDGKDRARHPCDIGERSNYRLLSIVPPTSYRAEQPSGSFVSFVNHRTIVSLRRYHAWLLRARCKILSPLHHFLGGWMQQRRNSIFVSDADCSNKAIKQQRGVFQSARDTFPKIRGRFNHSRRYETSLYLTFGAIENDATLRERFQKSTIERGGKGRKISEERQK